MGTTLGPAELAELEVMRQDYAARLPAMVRGIREALERLRQTPQDPGAQSVARNRAHDLAGTAGSFGFDALGEICGSIEAAIASLQSGVEFSVVAPVLCTLLRRASAA